MKFESYIEKGAEYGFRDVKITNAKGEIIFEMKNVWAPKQWTDKAVQIVASKYLRQIKGEQETSVGHLIQRVADTIQEWGLEQKYFDEENSIIFRNQLARILELQLSSFNSPIWFNLGAIENPTTSACFILGIEDNLGSIFDWYRKEGFIFHAGSGSGINISPLRSKKEKLSNGGFSSGPVSFMKAADHSAGIIKSAGILRRAAKLVAMDCDHPDIEEFIECKGLEELKANALIERGYDSSIGGEAYSTVAFQNSNHVVRLSDEFMELIEYNLQNQAQCKDSYPLRARNTDEVIEEVSARHILRQIAVNIWACGDPGVAFSDTIEKANTVKAFGPIMSSNPCSEFMAPNDTACNLASLNLCAFQKEDGTLDEELFRHVIKIMITAMDIIIDKSSYPTEKIKQNAMRLRPLGLGYTNLAAFLMRAGIAYGSEKSLEVISQITKLMTLDAIGQSVNLAGVDGKWPFLEFFCNIKHVKDWIKDRYFEELGHLTLSVRNSQLTLLAPTGTISFMMDCETTGIEPMIALAATKTMVGGGTVELEISKSFEIGMRRLGYTDEEIGVAKTCILKDGNLSNFEFKSPEHRRVFECALSNDQSSCITPEQHIDVMAAAQKYLHGAISKTVNLPNSATVEDIEKYIVLAWRKGLKAITFYRDNCRAMQPIQVNKKEETKGKKETLIFFDEAASIPREIFDAAEGLLKDKNVKHIGAEPSNSESHLRMMVEEKTEYIKSLEWQLKQSEAKSIRYEPHRHPLPADCPADRHKFQIGQLEGYIHIGKYSDGRPGEIFIKASKEGSTIAGMLDVTAILISIMLQYGVPIETIIEKLEHTKFEPAGFTGNKEIPSVTSLMDYLAKFLKRYEPDDKGGFYIPPEVRISVDQETKERVEEFFGSLKLPKEWMETQQDKLEEVVSSSDHVFCPQCGDVMARSGKCHTCPKCGFNTGCG
jgi:ribonucleoside-diphosphate reductase alpha chain